MTKLKLVAALALTVGMIGAGAGVLAQQILRDAQRRVRTEAVGLAGDADAPRKSPAEGQGRTDRFGDPLPEGAIARLGTMRLRHGNGSSLAFSPDGKALLTCGGDRSIRTWDIVSGRLLREQNLPPGPAAYSAVLSPDGRLLAFREARVWDVFYLWDVTRNRLLHKLSLGEKGEHRVAFSPDSTTLVMALSSGAVMAWDVETGQGRLLGRHKRERSSLSFTADGRLLSVNGLGHSLILWDLATGREQARQTLPDHVLDAVISPDGQTIAAWSWHNPEKDKGIEFRDAATGKPARGWIAPELKQVNTARFTPDGKLVLIGTKDGVLVWDPIAGKQLRTLSGGYVSNLMFSPDGKVVAASSSGDANFRQGSVLRVWDLATGTPHVVNSPANGHLGEVACIAFAPDGRTVASSCPHDRSVRLWDAASGRLLRLLAVDEDLASHALAFNPDGKHLFAGTRAAILQWEVATGREVGRYPLFEPGKEDRQYLLLMHLTEDGRTLLAVGQNLDSREFDWGLQAWDIATGKRLRSVSCREEDLWISYSHFSPDGRFLALPGGSICDAATGEERLRLPSEDMLRTPVAFSPDGALLTGGVRREIRQPGLQGYEMIAV